MILSGFIIHFVPFRLFMGAFTKKKVIFFAFFDLTPAFWEFKAVPLQRKLIILVPARDKNLKKNP